MEPRRGLASGDTPNERSNGEPLGIESTVEDFQRRLAEQFDTENDQRIQEPLAIRTHEASMDQASDNSRAARGMALPLRASTGRTTRPPVQETEGTQRARH